MTFVQHSMLNVIFTSTVWYLKYVVKMFSFFLKNVIMMLWKHQKFTVLKMFYKHKNNVYKMFLKMFLKNIFKTYFHDFYTTFHVIAAMFKKKNIYIFTSHVWYLKNVGKMTLLCYENIKCLLFLRCFKNIFFLRLQNVSQQCFLTTSLKHIFMTFKKHSMLLLKCFKNIFKMLFLHQMYDI